MTARGESGCSNKIFCYGGSNDVFLDLRPDGSADQGVRPDTPEESHEALGLKDGRLTLIVGRRRAVNGRSWGRPAWVSDTRK